MRLTRLWGRLGVLTVGRKVNFLSLFNVSQTGRCDPEVSYRKKLHCLVVEIELLSNGGDKPSVMWPLFFWAHHTFLFF